MVEVRFEHRYESRSGDFSVNEIKAQAIFDLLTFKTEHLSVANTDLKRFKWLRISQKIRYTYFLPQ